MNENLLKTRRLLVKQSTQEPPIVTRGTVLVAINDMENVVNLSQGGDAEMPRGARKKSETGIYHLVMRGINRQTIFEDAEDNIKFLQTIGRYTKENKFTLYAYCLMGNHVHLLVKEENENLSITMRRIGAGYVYWYNCKYERCGHLFQDRYKSEAVENDEYLLAVLRYIHQNPIKAGITSDPLEYSWSSYPEFMGKPKYINSKFVLDLFDTDTDRAKEKFKEFHIVRENGNFLDIEQNKEWRDQDAIELILNLCKISKCKKFRELNETKQRQYLKIISEKGLSIRQISRVTGLSRWAVHKKIED